MFSLLLSRIGGYLAAAVGILVAVLAALGLAKRAGRKEEQDKELEQSFKQSKEANEIDSQVRAMPDSELDKRLRDVQRKD